MAVAWALGVWATNSWVGMNAGPPNAWRGDTAPAPVVVTPTKTGGGGIQPRRKRLSLPYKPTGLGGYRKKKEDRLEDARDDAAEIAARLHDEFATDVAEKGRAQAERALSQAREAARAAMEAEARLAKVRDEEIGRLLRQKMQMDEDEALIMILQAMEDDE